MCHSFTAGGDKPGQEESLPYASVRKHAEPAFTSSPISTDLTSGHRRGDDFSESQSALTSGHGVRGRPATAEERSAFLQDGEKAKRGRSTPAEGRGGMAKAAADKGSVLQR